MGYMTNGLTFNALRGANTARLPQFKNKHGELAHSKKDGSDWSPAQWLQAVVDELADVVIYLDILAMRLGVDLGAAVMDKFNRVSVRVGSTVRLDADDWHYTERTK